MIFIVCLIMIVVIGGLVMYQTTREKVQGKFRENGHFQDVLDNPNINHDWVKQHFSSGPTNRLYLVTGGNGCLGSHIVEALIARGETNIRIFDLVDSKRFEDVPGVEVIIGDLTNYADVEKAMKNVDVVFHTAAVIQYWARHPFQLPIHERVNVQGTKNVVIACINASVSRLIQTSTTNVMMRHNGSAIEDVKYLDESAPYTDAAISPYGYTKMLAEKAVLEANSKKLRTCALRPPGIFGPRDHLVEAFVKQGLPMQVMQGMGDQDWIYVENLVFAHLLAEQNLDNEKSPAAGQAFFVTNGENNQGYIRTDKLYVKIAQALYGEKFDRRKHITSVPLWLLYAIAYPMDWFHQLTKGRYVGPQVTKLTPITIQYTTCHLRFNDNKIRKSLNYKEVFTHDEAIERMKQYNLT